MRWCARCQRQHWFDTSCAEVSPGTALLVDIYCELGSALAREFGRLLDEARERNERQR